MDKDSAAPRYGVVLVTTSSQQEGEAIAKALVEARMNGSLCDSYACEFNLYLARADSLRARVANGNKNRLIPIFQA